MLTTLISNTNPNAINFKQTIILSTLDQNNSNAPINEGYIVSGPVSPGVTPIFIAGGTKAVIPLTNSSGAGSPFLKIHFPTNPNGNIMYLTYCVSNPYMVDGYYDYKTGVPTIYYNALRAWINSIPPLLSGSPTLKTRSLKLSAYGNLTNKAANSVTFYIKIQGIFGSSISSPTITLSTLSIA